MSSEPQTSARLHTSHIASANTQIFNHTDSSAPDLCGERPQGFMDRKARSHSTGNEGVGSNSEKLSTKLRSNLTESERSLTCMEVRSSIAAFVLFSACLTAVVLLIEYRSSFDSGTGRNSDLQQLGATANDAVSAITIASFLKDKVERGLVSGDDEGKELAGLSLSAQALLSQLLQDLKEDAETEITFQQQEKESGLFNFYYGLTRVVRRLVICSAYRTSPRDFTVVALSPDFTTPTSNPDFRDLPPKDPAVHRICIWVAGGSDGAPHFRTAEALNETGRTYVKNGVMNFMWSGDMHDASYDNVLIHCSFAEPVGLGSDGGFLYFNITHGYGASSPTELAPVFHEPARKNGVDTSLYDPNRSTFQYEFAYCSGPLFTNLTSAHVTQFLMYHISMFGESVHFFIYYTRGIDPDAVKLLRHLSEQGVVTLVDFSKESEYYTWYHSQGIAINDCLYRTKFLSKWSLFWDLDEYLHISPPLTLSSLLETHTDAPWISFGKMDYSLAHCSPPEVTDRIGEEWSVERMLYRQKEPVGGCEDCEGPMGSRKWMANPRKVGSGKIHSPGWDTLEGGVNLSTKIARMNHYRGLVAPRGKDICQHIISNSTASIVDDMGEELCRDEELATIVQSLKKSAHDRLKNIFPESFL